MSIKQLVTAEDLWEMPDVSGKTLELVDGEVVEVSPVGTLHMQVMKRLFMVIDSFVEQHDLGLVMPDGQTYVLWRGPDRVRVPDVSFIAWERVPDDGTPEGFWEGPPTLAVEVVSPNDRAEDTHVRVRDYLKAGTLQVWVLWPRQRTMTVYTAEGGVRELGPEDRLDGGDVLPGFAVRVGDLFEVRRRR